jgi:hypothetical protein
MRFDALYCSVTQNVKVTLTNTGKSRWFPTMSGFDTSVTGTRSGKSGTQMEREWNAFQTRSPLGYFWTVLYKLQVS